MSPHICSHLTSSDDAPQENVEGGHGGAADNKQRAHMWALTYNFLAQTLGLEEAPGGEAGAQTDKAALRKVLLSSKFSPKVQ